MYYARTNKPGTQDSLALVLSLLWQVMSCLICLCSHNKKARRRRRRRKNLAVFISWSLPICLKRLSFLEAAQWKINLVCVCLPFLFVCLFVCLFFGDFWDYPVYLFIHSLKYLNLKAKFEQERQQSQNNELLKAESTRDTAIVNSDLVNFSRMTTPSLLKFTTASASRPWNCSSLEHSGL